MEHLKWPNTTQIVKTAISNLTKKAIDRTSSKGINNMCVTIKSKHQRLNKGLTIKHTGPSSRNNSNFTAFAADNFNNLPSIFKNPEMTTEQFKKEIKTYIKTENN